MSRTAREDQLTAKWLSRQSASSRNLPCPSIVNNEEEGDKIQKVRTEAERKRKERLGVLLLQAEEGKKRIEEQRKRLDESLALKKMQKEVALRFQRQNVERSGVVRIE